MNRNPRIIAIETSSRLGSVAVADGPNLLAEESFTGDLRHGAELLVTMDRLCNCQGWKPTDIDHLYISAGPGSFTGIRIAVTVAKAFAFAHPGVRIVSVPSIGARALNAERAGREQGVDIKTVAVVLEAGRKQIFTAVFETVRPPAASEEFVPGLRTLIEQTVMAPADLLAHTGRPLYLLGEGLDYHRDELTADRVFWLDESYWPGRAGYVLRCGYLRACAGLFAQPDELTPMYLRRPEAVEKWEQLHGP